MKVAFLKCPIKEPIDIRQLVNERSLNLCIVKSILSKFSIMLTHGKGGWLQRLGATLRIRNTNPERCSVSSRCPHPSFPRVNTIENLILSWIRS